MTSGDFGEICDNSVPISRGLDNYVCPKYAENDVDAKSLFQILIRENSDMLVAYLRAGVRDLHAVDDLYQETVLTAWRKMDSYDRDKPIGPCLRGIAGKLMLAHYRKTNKAAQPLDEKTLDWLDTRFAAIHSMPGDTEERGLSEIETTLNLANETLK